MADLRWLYALMVPLLVFLICDLGGCRAARYGGSRYSGGSYRSSGGSYRSSYSSYRSSYRSYRSSYSRSPSRLYSSYVSYVPAYRYSRVYAGSSLGRYAYYYSLYWAHARSATYMRRTAPSGSVGVCVNYEADGNGTVMGVFTCPLSFEPADFTSCCGEDYAEYCCTSATANKTTYIIVGVLVLLLCLGVAAFLIYYCNRKKMNPKVYPRGNGQVIQVPQVQGRGRPGRGQRLPPPPQTVQPVQPPPYTMYSSYPPARPGAPPYPYSAPMPPQYSPAQPSAPPPTVSARVESTPRQASAPNYNEHDAVTQVA